MNQQLLNLLRMLSQMVADIPEDAQIQMGSGFVNAQTALCVYLQEHIAEEIEGWHDAIQVIV